MKINLEDSLDYRWSRFSELSKELVYEILSLRQNIFIVEQECWYQDADGKDLGALHLTVKNKDILVAYLRVLEPGASYSEPRLGRIVVKKDYRGIGLGKKIINVGKEKCYKLFPNKQIKISAQIHLQEFYENLGFNRQGEPYDEDGILHIEMVSP
tara:strand:- start:360 stop:824 length:465 start_codon:yes stop_codon:yes gene_type:complete